MEGVQGTIIFFAVFVLFDWYLLACLSRAGEGGGGTPYNLLQRDSLPQRSTFLGPGYGKGVPFSGRMYGWVSFSMHRYRERVIF